MRAWLTAAAVFLAVLAFWAPSAAYRLVNYDDNDYVFDNSEVLKGLTPEVVVWAWKDTGHAANWHPLTWMSLALDVSISGVKTRPVGKTPRFETPDFNRLSSVMHLHNAVLHAANAAFLFLLLLALQAKTSRQPDSPPAAVPQLALSALLALIWAVHPLRAEAVAWVSERKEVLSCFFMLLTLLFHVVETAHGRRGMGRLFALYACYALALAAKPVAVSLPAVVLALDWCLAKRIRWGRFFAVSAMAAGCVGMTLLAQREVIEGSYLTFRERLPNVLAAYGTYAWQTVVPTRLSLMYPILERFDWRMTFLSGVLLWGGWAFRSSGAACLAVAWAGVGLLPMIGILQVGCQAHADRYTYWVGCGVVAAIQLLLVQTGVGKTAGRWMLAAMVSAAAGYGVLGWRQREAWRDTEHVFGMSYRNVPCSMSGTAWAQAVKVADPAAAERIYREVRERFPDDAFAVSQLALFLAVSGPKSDFSEARAIAEEAIQLDPGCAYAYEALGFAAVRSGDYAAAVEHFEAALARGSDSPVTRKGLADAKKGLEAQVGPIRRSAEAAK